MFFWSVIDFFPVFCFRPIEHSITTHRNAYITRGGGDFLGSILGWRECIPQATLKNIFVSKIKLNIVQTSKLLSFTTGYLTLKSFFKQQKNIENRLYFVYVLCPRKLMGILINPPPPQGVVCKNDMAKFSIHTGIGDCFEKLTTMYNRTLNTNKQTHFKL